MTAGSVSVLAGIAGDSVQRVAWRTEVVAAAVGAVVVAPTTVKVTEEARRVDEEVEEIKVMTTRVGTVMPAEPSGAAATAEAIAEVDAMAEAKLEAKLGTAATRAAAAKVAVKER